MRHSTERECWQGDDRCTSGHGRCVFKAPMSGIANCQSHPLKKWHHAYKKARNYWTSLNSKPLCPAAAERTTTQQDHTTNPVIASNPNYTLHHHLHRLHHTRVCPTLRVQKSLKMRRSVSTLPLAPSGHDVQIDRLETDSCAFLRIASGRLAEQRACQPRRCRTRGRIT